MKPLCTCNHLCPTNAEYRARSTPEDFCVHDTSCPLYRATEKYQQFQQAESWGYWGGPPPSKQEQVAALKSAGPRCAALHYRDEVQCENVGTALIHYHGDREIYSSRDSRPVWVNVWLCKDHQG